MTRKRWAIFAVAAFAWLGLAGGLFILRDAELFRQTAAMSAAESAACASFPDGTPFMSSPAGSPEAYSCFTRKRK